MYPVLDSNNILTWVIFKKYWDSALPIIIAIGIMWVNSITVQLSLFSAHFALTSGELDFVRKTRLLALCLYIF